ncbi:hypothetical protein METHP14_40074 [Pseudomonas sp. P14-2025]
MCGYWKIGANPLPVTISTTPIAENIRQRLALLLKRYSTSTESSTFKASDFYPPHKPAND